MCGRTRLQGERAFAQDDGVLATGMLLYRTVTGLESIQMWSLRHILSQWIAMAMLMAEPRHHFVVIAFEVAAEIGGVKIGGHLEFVRHRFDNSSLRR